MQISVQSNLSQVTRALDGLGKQLIPKATRNALNDTAFDVRKDTIERVWPSSVTVRNPAFLKAMLMPIRGQNRATTQRLVSTVQNYPTGPRNREYLQRLATGGVKTPRGQHIAIPGRDMPLRSRGGVTAARRPRNILNRPKVFKTKLKSGQDAIVRRVGKSRYPLQMLYILEPDGRIRKQFDFYDEAKQTARRAFNKHFTREFKRAKLKAAA